MPKPFALIALNRTRIFAFAGNQEDKCIQGQHRTSKSIKTLNSTNQTLIPSSSNLLQNLNPPNTTHKHQINMPENPSGTCSLHLHACKPMEGDSPQLDLMLTSPSCTCSIQSSCLQIHGGRLATGGLHPFPSSSKLLSVTIHNRNVNIFHDHCE